MRRHAFHASLWAIVLGCALGCSDGLPNQVYPVTGRLLVGDKPAAGAHLAFHAIDQRIVSRPVAITESDGSFRLMTYAANDGAPAGDYVVTIFWRDESNPDEESEDDDLIKHDRLRGRYFDSRKSTLRATVQPGPNEIVIKADRPNSIDLPKK